MVMETPTAPWCSHIPTGAPEISQLVTLVSDFYTTCKHAESLQFSISLANHPWPWVDPTDMHAWEQLELKNRLQDSRICKSLTLRLGPSPQAAMLTFAKSLLGEVSLMPLRLERSAWCISTRPCTKPLARTMSAEFWMTTAGQMLFLCVPSWNGSPLQLGESVATPLLMPTRLRTMFVAPCSRLNHTCFSELLLFCDTVCMVLDKISQGLRLPGL